METPQKYLTSHSGVILIAISYSMSDILAKWSDLSQCSKPIQVWVLVMHLLVATFLVASGLGRGDADSADTAECQLTSWYISRPKPRRPAAFAVTWTALLLFLSFMVYIGSEWLSHVLEHSPTCLPKDSHPSAGFVAVVLALSLLFIPICASFAAYVWYVRVWQVPQTQELSDDPGDVVSVDPHVYGMLEAELERSQHQWVTSSTISELPLLEDDVTEACSSSWRSDILSETSESSDSRVEELIEEMNEHRCYASVGEFCSDGALRRRCC